MINIGNCHIECGDSAVLIKDELEPCSIDAVISDPPYFINVLAHDWDKQWPDIQIWKNCFDVLKPGGFCLAFGAPRKYHRLACQIEDCGFVIRDTLCWMTANGFPKSLNISLKIDEKYGVQREIVGKRIHPTLKQAPKSSSRGYHRDGIKSFENMESWDITAPSTDDAKTWNGWGTQLKPSWEAIILAQKPIEENFAHNVLTYKVGGLNIDECRIPYASEDDKKSLESFLHFESKNCGNVKYFSANDGEKKQVNIHPLGRFPANVMWFEPLLRDYDKYFLVPKPSTGEKGEYNSHDTVKPIELMERLIKLVTPNPHLIKQDVKILDPFLGSGTTAVACQRLDRSCYGFELNKDYFDIAKRRIKEHYSINKEMSFS